MAYKSKKSTPKKNKKITKESSIVLYLTLAIICLLAIGAVAFFKLT